MIEECGRGRGNGDFVSVVSRHFGVTQNIAENVDARYFKGTKFLRCMIGGIHMINSLKTAKRKGWRMHTTK